MEINETKSTGASILSVTGRIVGPEIVDICKKIEQIRFGDVERVYLDLSGVTFIDSSGIGGLIYSQQLLTKAAIDFFLVGPFNLIQQLFRDCKIEKIFSVVEKVLEPNERPAVKA